MAKLDPLLRKIDNCMDCTLGLCSAEEIMDYLLVTGEINEPRIMFVAVNLPDSNPTIQENYECERLALAGNRKFWKMLIESDLLKVDAELSQQINSVDAK